MKIIHLISHTHWDREWYRTFQQFRLKLVHLVDGLLDILEHDRDYRHFMLDGQTIALDDYLLMRPEAESRLRRLIQEGRLLIGPWYILPDMFLVSPEAHIRNLLAGDREARRFGSKMMVGYMPDSFGHIGQMPQILHGFGIDNACLWRGLDDQPAEFWWHAPDGTRVLMMYLRDSYSNGAYLNANDAERFTQQIEQAADSLAPHSAASHLLVMYGTDHMEPPRETVSAVQAANTVLTEYCVEHSTLPAYLNAVKSELGDRELEIPAVDGELRSSKRSHLLPGVLSTRMWIKQRNHACETLLEKWAEPFSTFASLTGDNRPLTDSFRPSSTVHRRASIVRQAWQLLMQCHPHDSICGCSIDQVHEEMRPRFDQVEQIGEEITKQSLEILAAVVNTSNQLPVTSDQSSIVVFNPLSSTRTDAVTAEISLPMGVADFEITDEAGNVIPHQSANGKTMDLIHVRVRREELGGMLAMVNEGRAGNLAIQDIQFERLDKELRVEAIFADNANPRVDVWNTSVEAFQEYLNDTSIETFHIHARTPYSANIVFAANDVPGLGWKTFYVRAKVSTAADIKITPLMRALSPLGKLRITQKYLMRLSQRKIRPPYRIENDSLTVELSNADGTLTVTDKITGKVCRGLNRFVDTGDCGDEYNFSPPPTDLKVDSPTLRGVTIIHGSVQRILEFTLELPTPVALDSERKSRSAEQVMTRITSRVILTNGIPRVDIHTRVENRAKDHRLRVHFPAPFIVSTADYDGHFEVVNRPIGFPAFDNTWVEEPRPEVPQCAFASISDGKNSLTIANRGLPEVEVIQNQETSESEIAITLLRCVGWLSRDDFTTRKGHAGPFLETPGAQMLGTWDFDYAIIVGRDTPSGHSGIPPYQEAWNFESPLRAVATDIHSGTLPCCGSMIHVDHPSFVVSAVKATENDKGWIVRGYNISGDEIAVTLTPWRRFENAERVNLAEDTVGRLEVGASGEVALTLRPHEIVSVKFQVPEQM